MATPDDRLIDASHSQNLGTQLGTFATLPAASSESTSSASASSSSAPSTTASSSSYQAAPVFTLNVRTLTGQNLRVELPNGAASSVWDIKVGVENLQGVPPEFQRLIFSGRELEDSQILSQVNVADNSVIHLVLRQNQPPRAQPVNIRPDVLVNMGAPADLMNRQPLNNGANPGADMSRVWDAWQLGRVVKMFAIIDAIFLLIWTFSYWPLFVGVLLAFCGYYGARQFKWPFICAYILYLLLSMALRGYWIYISEGYLLIIVLALGILIELYILRVTVKFLLVARQLTESDKIELRQMQQTHQQFGGLF